MSTARAARIPRREQYAVGSQTNPGGTAFWWDFIHKYITPNMVTGAHGNAATREAQLDSILWGCPGWRAKDARRTIDNAPLAGWIAPGYGMNFAPRYTEDFPADGVDMMEPAGNRVTYGQYLMLHVPSWPGPVPGRFQRMGQIRNASRVSMLGDARFRVLDVKVHPTQLTGPPADFDTLWLGNGAGQTTFDYWRHGKYPRRLGPMFDISPAGGGRPAYNILYFDGHVETVTELTEGDRSIRQRFPN
jgi:prepilin-type processing-associated H-X9-DG protein